MTSRNASPGRPSWPGPGRQIPITPSPTSGYVAPWRYGSCGRKVPGVDGALTVPPMVQAVPPVRNTSASSMQSPPAMAEATIVNQLVCSVGPPRLAAHILGDLYQRVRCRRTTCIGEGGRTRSRQAYGHQAVIVRDSTRYGRAILRGNYNYSVLHV